MLLIQAIKRFWAIAKQKFSRDCITEADYSNNALFKALVMNSILEASSNSLSKHVFSCVRLMKNEISV